MSAYFSSKLLKQAQGVLASALLLACLLGTHWIGYAHGISHATQQHHTQTKLDAAAIDSSFSHGSEVCHLFDALSLAGFIPAPTLDSAAINTNHIDQASNLRFHFAQTSVAAYRSRAPPSWFL